VLYHERRNLIYDTLQGIQKRFYFSKKMVDFWVPVTHICNPSYSGGRDQEDHSLKPAHANSYRDPILKNPITKRAGGVAGAEGISTFKPSTTHTHIQMVDSIFISIWKNSLLHSMHKTNCGWM
jgi:hypothetical protein